TDGSQGGDMVGREPRACGHYRIAEMSFGAGGDDVATGAHAAALAEADAILRNFDVLEHDDSVCAFRDGRAGHDLERVAGLERCGGSSFSGAEGSDDGDPVAGSDGSSLHSVAVASGAM